jgi:hypothetical protein
MTVHPLIKRLLDGEIELGALPPELRREGQRALRVLERVDRDPVTLPAQLEDRVLARLEGRTIAPARPWWRRLAGPRDVRLRVRPWLLGPVAATIAVLVLVLGRQPVPLPLPDTAAADSALVRFVYYAPRAKSVTVAGSFNDWGLESSPLARGAGGVWTITLALPAGQHQYAFVVDGREWAVDPAAPAVDDGLGHRNSVVAVSVSGGRVL